MEENLNIFKTLIYKLGWILKNQQYENDIVLLLVLFSSEYAKINMDECGVCQNIEITKQNGDILKFIFSDVSDNIQIIYMYNGRQNIEYRSFTKFNNYIEVEETETNIIKYDSKIFSIGRIRKIKKYKNNHLFESSFSEQLKDLVPDSKKSFSYSEKMYVMPSGEACKKINIESEENSIFTPGTTYLKTDLLADNSFNNSYEYIGGCQIFSITNEEEYNSFYLKHKISLISNTYISVVYEKEDKSLYSLSGILISSNDNVIKILVDDDQINIDYDKIINITSGENIFQFNFNDNDKIMSLNKNDQ